jgi:cation transport protein ChaC
LVEREPNIFRDRQALDSRFRGNDDRGVLARPTTRLLKTMRMTSIKFARTIRVKQVSLPCRAETVSADTRANNQRMRRHDHHPQVWLFGYGSLIYKADFAYSERRPASIRHWTRRFWQGSHDHRGTPTAPGRVVTLIAEPDAVCVGMAYLVTPQTFSHLDVREKNGYLRLTTDIHLDDGRHVEGLVYIANEKNAAFLGPASEREIARHIAACSGPSGANRDYLTQLAAALRELQAHDPHVFAIEQHLLELT